jgi:hypothetical protein
MTNSNNSGNNSSTNDLGSLLRQSPFSALLDIPGVTEETIIQAFGSAVGGNGNNPFGNGSLPTAGSDPFTGFGDPNAPGSSLTGGVNPWAAINQSGSNPFANGENPFASGSNPLTSGNNPFAGGDILFASGNNPFVGGENPFASGNNPFA